MLGGWGMQLVISAVVIGGMSWMPSEFTARAFGIAAAALVTLFAIRLKLGALGLRALKVLQPADGSLVTLVRTVSSQLGTPVAGVWVLGGVQAQAYALPVTGELWFSRRLLAICAEDEVRAITAHEIAHLGESRLTVAGRVAASLTWWPLVFTPPAAEMFGFGGFVGLMLVCLGLSWLSRRMSHPLERRADDVAANARRQECDYASALEKVYRENQLPAVNPRGQRTHPSLYDRLTAAGRVPDYPRPQPPRRVSWTAKLLFVLAIAASVGV